MYWTDKNPCGQEYLGPIDWPARSPDLTPMDYFLWGTIKDRVFKRNYNNLADLRQAITAECGNISLELCRKVCNSYPH